jgi:hypothetical protein
MRQRWRKGNKKVQLFLVQTQTTENQQVSNPLKLTHRRLGNKFLVCFRLSQLQPRPPFAPGLALFDLAQQPAPVVPLRPALVAGRLHGDGLEVTRAGGGPFARARVNRPSRGESLLRQRLTTSRMCRSRWPGRQSPLAFRAFFTLQNDLEPQPTAA